MIATLFGRKIFDRLLVGIFCTLGRAARHSERAEKHIFWQKRLFLYYATRQLPATSTGKLREKCLQVRHRQTYDRSGARFAFTSEQ
jgi:hypothetical protein